MAAGYHRWKATLKENSQQIYTRSIEHPVEQPKHEEEEIDTAVAEEVAIEPEQTMRTITILRVRKEATVESDVIGRFNADELVTVIGEESNGWFQVDYNGETGYVDGRYLTTP